MNQQTIELQTTSYLLTKITTRDRLACPACGGKVWSSTYTPRARTVKPQKRLCQRHYGQDPSHINAV